MREAVALSSLTAQEAASIEIDPQPGVPDNRQALIDGAINEARGRLVMIRQDIDKSVNDFNSRAHDATEDLKGKSDSDMGSALFKVLVDVAIAAIPGAEEAAIAYKIAEEVGKEAFKGFVDTWVDGVDRVGAVGAGKARQREVGTAANRDQPRLCRRGVPHRPPRKAPPRCSDIPRRRCSPPIPGGSGSMRRRRTTA